MLHILHEAVPSHCLTAWFWCTKHSALSPCLVRSRHHLQICCPQGLGITSGIVINNMRQSPLVLTMFDQKVIPQPAFTVVLTVRSPILFRRAPTPGAQLQEAPQCSVHDVSVRLVDLCPENCRTSPALHCAHRLCATGRRRRRPRLSLTFGSPAAKHRRAVVGPARHARVQRPTASHALQHLPLSCLTTAPSRAPSERAWHAPAMCLGLHG